MYRIKPWEELTTFGKRRHIYTFRNICAEDTTLELADGATKIFLNTKGTLNDVAEGVKAFLDYVDGHICDDPLVREIDEAIQRIKQENEKRVSYMTFAMKMMEERKAGFKEGERQGIAKGRTESLASSIRNMMKNMGVSLEKAMDVLQIPADERTKYAALVRD